MEESCNEPETPFIELKVIGVDIHQDLGKPYSSFIIQACHNSKMWTVEKRFSEFYAFDKELRKIIGNCDFLPPPLRKTFFSPRAEEIDHRKHLLNEYVNALSLFTASRAEPHDLCPDEDSEKSYWTAVHAIYGFVKFAECSSSVERIRSIQVYPRHASRSNLGVFIRVL